MEPKIQFSSFFFRDPCVSGIAFYFATPRARTLIALTPRAPPTPSLCLQHWALGLDSWPFTRVCLQNVARSLDSWPFTRLPPAPGSRPRILAFDASASSSWLSASNSGIFRVCLQHLALGLEFWPFSRLPPGTQTQIFLRASADRSAGVTLHIFLEGIQTKQFFWSPLMQHTSCQLV